jgi:biopolymer transport protein ExbB
MGRLSRSQTDARLFSWDDGKQALVISVDGTKLRCDASGQNGARAGDVDLPIGRWVHVAVTGEPGKNLTVYTDGRERGTQRLAGSLPEPTADIVVGSSLQGKHGFAGDIDEVGIAGVSRAPPGFARRHWARARDDAPVLSGGESTSGGGRPYHPPPGGHRPAITLDGWLIIGILLVMMALTWVIFINKFVMLRRMKKGNASFSESFTGADRIADLNGNGEGFEGSSLHRIYRAGMEELARRLQRGQGPEGTGILPPGRSLHERASSTRRSCRRARASPQASCCSR